MPSNGRPLEEEEEDVKARYISSVQTLIYPH
jgi:hypothetical protein